MVQSDWIEWTGGDCPVQDDTLVDVRHIDGTVSEKVLAGDAIYLDDNHGYDWWAHYDCLPANANGFIVAYRVVAS